MHLDRFGIHKHQNPLVVDFIPTCFEGDHNCKHFYRGNLGLAGQPCIYELLADPSPELEGLLAFRKKNTSYPREQQTIGSAFGQTAICKNDGVRQPRFELVNPSWGTVSNQHEPLFQ